MTNDEPITTDVEIADIRIGKRLRKFRPELVVELAESMRELGLLVPIVLRPRRGGGYWLVAGWHRLEAAKHLRWPTICATVFKRMSRLQAELAEIASNLCVAPLSPAERLILTYRKRN
jgi:ParB family transcriptional regulator, chromosome partitioning protein